MEAPLDLLQGIHGLYTEVALIPEGLAHQLSGSPGSHGQHHQGAAAPQAGEGIGRPGTGGVEAAGGAVGLFGSGGGAGFPDRGAWGGSSHAGPLHLLPDGEDVLEDFQLRVLELGELDADDDLAAPFPGIGHGAPHFEEGHLGEVPDLEHGEFLPLVEEAQAGRDAQLVPQLEDPVHAEG